MPRPAHLPGAGRVRERLLDPLTRQARQDDVVVHEAHGESVARLRDELLAYPGMPARWRRPDPAVPVTPVLTMRLRRGDVALAFFTTLTMLATPRDVALEQLRIECIYPADAATEDTARCLAEQPAG